MTTHIPPADHPPRPRGRANNLRWGMAVLCFAGLSVNYVDRSALSVALPSMNADLGLDASVQGLILGTFFLAYAGFQLPAGVLIDRIGVKKSFAVFTTNYAFRDGYMHPGDAPGLGVEIDEEAAAKYPYEPKYLPVNRLRDGSVHDW